MGVFGEERNGVMEQLELPFKGDKPPVWACCDSCKYNSNCYDPTGKCLHYKGKYTEIGGMFYKYYNFFEMRGD